MQSMIIVIMSVVLYGSINILRVVRNIRNQNLFLEIYTPEIRKKWEKVYAKPGAFLARAIVLRLALVGMMVVSAVLFRNVSEENAVFELLIGFLSYLAFLMIFDEARALIAQSVFLTRRKAGESGIPTLRDYYESQLMFFPFILLIGIVPGFFLLKNFGFEALGSLVGGVYFVARHAAKLLKAADAVRKERNKTGA